MVWVPKDCLSAREVLYSLLTAIRCVAMNPPNLSDLLDRDPNLKNHSAEIATRHEKTLFTEIRFWRPDS